MNIQLLVCDLDGTAIPKATAGLPSKKVIEAIQRAKKYCHVSIATGRPLELCEPILASLGIEDLCILNGGSHLYSCKTKQYVWKKEIDPQLLQTIFKELRGFDYLVADEKHLLRSSIKTYCPTDPVALSCIFAMPHTTATSIVKKIEQYPGVNAYIVSSWTEGAYDIHITHELANKKYALVSLASHLNIDLGSTMVVGDGGNDLPLFEVAGLKVAMGNSDQTLIERADWIAPSVDDDGLAVAINKYIGS